MSLMPRQKVPALALPLAGGGRFDLAQEKPDAFSMLVVYRGLHCPICKTYLAGLNEKLDKFWEVGVKPIAATSDSQERAEKAKTDWALNRLPLGYDFSIEAGRTWGLHVSAGISEREPALFLEPGLFLIKPDLTLYAASVQTMPFTRPNLDEILQVIPFLLKNNYPARGEA